MQERDWSRIPARFAYVQAMAEEYDRWLQRHRYQDETAINSLTEAQLKRLSELYHTIDARGDAEPMSVWLFNVPHSEQRDERGVYWPVFLLFCVFRRLGKKGIAPFDSNRVRFWVPDPPSDWSKLPPNLRYIAEFAEKFGGYQSDDDVDAFVKSADGRQMSELAAASERIRMNDHAAEIYRWLDQYDTVEHQEAARVMWMLNLMNEAGVPIED